MEQKYRQNSVGVILDRENNVLLVARANDPLHWQFPQGGLQPLETPEQAIMRELLEELGTSSFSILSKAPEQHSYQWDEYLIRDEYIGQIQTIFLLRFTGVTSQIKVDRRELKGSLWVSPERLESFLHPYRQPIWHIITKYYNILPKATPRNIKTP